MPGYRRLLVAAEMRKAGKLRHCFHNREHAIKKGEPVLVVKVNMKESGYCLACATKMLKRAGRDLAELEKEIKKMGTI